MSSWWPTKSSVVALIANRASLAWRKESLRRNVILQSISKSHVRLCALVLPLAQWATRWTTHWPSNIWAIINNLTAFVALGLKCRARCLCRTSAGSSLKKTWLASANSKYSSTLSIWGASSKKMLRQCRLQGSTVLVTAHLSGKSEHYPKLRISSQYRPDP